VVEDRYKEWIAEANKKDVETLTNLHGAIMRVYNSSGNVIETHEHTGDFKEW
jgi:hypothetical protein